MVGYLTSNIFRAASFTILPPERGKSVKSLTTPRFGHTATLLSNGKVLVVRRSGGGDYLTSSEIYDPATGVWTTTGSLNTSRINHTTTLLPDGKVLVAGGLNNYVTVIPLSSVELYDPSTGIWTVTNSLNLARNGHTATLLPNGQILVAGGANINTLTSAELYNPGNGTWTTISSMNTPRGKHTATLLPGGNVLIAGGNNPTPTTAVPLSSAEIYDPVSNAWTITNSLNTARFDHRAALLPNGQVLIAGGATTYWPSNDLSSTELYDPSINPTTGNWINTGVTNLAPSDSTATLLPNGQVLVAGGQGFPLRSPRPVNWTIRQRRPRQTLAR